MPGKPITPEGLARDVQYTLRGIDCHEVLFHIAPPRPGLSVLEAGCGSGKLGLHYWLRGATVTLLDIDPEVLVYTRALTGAVLSHADCCIFHESSHLPEIHEGDVRRMQYFDNVFDLVFNEGVPQHWRDDSVRMLVLKEMVRVTKHGGAVVVIGSNAQCKEMMSYAARVAHTYMSMDVTQRPWVPDDLRLKLAETGLEDVEVAPVQGSWKESMLLFGYGRKP